MKTYSQQLEKITFRRPEEVYYLNPEWVLANRDKIDSPEFRELVAQHGGCSVVARHTGFGRGQIERLAQMIGAPVYKRPEKPAPPPPVEAQPQLQLALTGDADLDRQLRQATEELTRLRELADRRFARCVLLGVQLNKANRALERASKRKARLRIANLTLRRIAELVRSLSGPSDRVECLNLIGQMTVHYVKPPVRYEGGEE